MGEETGRRLWDVQKAFNDKFWESRGGYPKTEEALTVATKDYALHLIKEVTEVLDELSFKMHRAKRGSADRVNVLEELIDVQKFLWGIMQLWGFDYDAFVSEFRRKSAVVEQRWAQEQSLPQLEAHPCVLIDIDGVLADWDAGFYGWVSSCTGVTFSALDDLLPPGSASSRMTAYSARKWYEAAGLQVQEEVKRKFRQSGAKAELALLPGAKELLYLVRQCSQLKIVLLTNRPYAEHYRIYPDTLEWLEKNGLPYDAIVWAHDKGLEAVRQFKNIAWAVDDKPRNVARLREAGVTTVHLNPSDPEADTATFVSFANRLLSERVTLENVGYEWYRRTEERAEVVP